MEQGIKRKGEEDMKRAGLVVVLIVFALFAVAVQGFAKKAGTRSGAALFKQNCSPCHPDGGNIINPQKTLHKKDREANNIKKPQDIVNKMRNPGPGMTKFDEKTIPYKEALKIAKYILKTFK